jgi:2-oxoglutarate ferredoxin oxidoreductase subunit alpha
LQEKYRKMMENEVRYEKIDCDDAEYILVAYGSAARICQKSIGLAREEGIKLGLIRPVTLFPFPYDEIAKLAEHVKGFMSVELNAGQMVEDVKLAVGKKVNVEFYGRMGGMIPTPVEILDVFKEKFTGG